MAFVAGGAATRAAAVRGRAVGAAPGLRAGLPGNRTSSGCWKPTTATGSIAHDMWSLPGSGPMLDLLVRDSEHPRALAFQCRAIARDLEKVANSLGITR